MFCSSCKKVSVSFTIISSIAATTRITINKMRTNFLIKGIFKNKTMYEICMVTGKLCITDNCILFMIILFVKKYLQ